MAISSVSEHYDALLARHYEWMFGVPFEAKVDEQRRLLAEAGVDASPGGRAVDLGCGPGFQSMALAELGFRVLSIDTSAELIAGLAARAAVRPIETRLGDLCELAHWVEPDTAHVVVCMGDTLTHLPGRDDVSALFRAIARALRPGGLFVLTYRDLAAGELRGADRFIPVRADDERIMTCFLEYEDADRVVVTDLVHERDAAGRWQLRRSAYRKLRLASAWVREQLAAAGLRTRLERSDRMVLLAAEKPS